MSASASQRERVKAHAAENVQQYGTVAQREMKVLEVLCQAEGSLSVAEIARRAGLTKPMVGAALGALKKRRQALKSGGSWRETAR